MAHAPDLRVSELTDPVAIMNVHVKPSRVGASSIAQQLPGIGSRQAAAGAPKIKRKHADLRRRLRANQCTFERHAADRRFLGPPSNASTRYSRAVALPMIAHQILARHKQQQGGHAAAPGKPRRAPAQAPAPAPSRTRMPTSEPASTEVTLNIDLRMSTELNKFRHPSRTIGFDADVLAAQPTMPTLTRAQQEQYNKN